MSHEDAVVKLPRGFKVIASTNSSKLTIIENSKSKIYGVQFHPEVTHTQKREIKYLKIFCFLFVKSKNIGIQNQKKN